MSTFWPLIFSFRYLKNNNSINLIIGCKARHQTINIDKFSKYYISKVKYKQDNFPDFFGGPASVISGDIIGKLYLLTIEMEVSSIFMDNVNVNVMCREYIEVLSVEHLGFLCLVGIYELLKINLMTLLFIWWIKMHVDAIKW